jgi:hypothetical protein
MSGVSYFEIGGELIELKAEYDYATGRSSATERNIQRKMAKDVREIKKVPKMVFPDPSGEEMGTYETIGNAVGLVAGVYFGVVTFPVTQADSPLIGPADLAWFGATIRFTQKAQAGGRLIGRRFD